MNHYKERLYFFSDLDGTLLYKKSGNLYPSLRNERVIQNFVGSGHSFIMATGRGYADIKTIAENLNSPVEYAITNNGAFIYKNREEIFSNTLTSDQIENVLQAAAATKIKYNEALLFVENGDVYMRGKDILGTIRRFAAAIKRKRRTHFWKDRTLDNLLQKNLRFPKICFIIYNREAVIKLEDALKAAFGNQLSIYCSSPFCLEICDANVNKANAIKLIAQRENLTMEQIAFVGDSGNDVCVFQECTHTYIMSHAHERYHVNGVKVVDDVADAILDFSLYHKTKEEQDVAGIDE